MFDSTTLIIRHQHQMSPWIPAQPDIATIALSDRLIYFSIDPRNHANDVVNVLLNHWSPLADEQEAIDPHPIFAHDGVRPNRLAYGDSNRSVTVVVLQGAYEKL